MNKKDKAIILKVKQELEQAIADFAADKLESGEFRVVNAKNELGKMLGEASELES